MDTFLSLLLTNTKDLPEHLASRTKRLGLWETIDWGEACARVSVLAQGLAEPRPGVDVSDQPETHGPCMTEAMEIAARSINNLLSGYAEVMHEAILADEECELMANDWLEYRVFLGKLLEEAVEAREFVYAGILRAVLERADGAYEEACRNEAET